MTPNLLAIKEFLTNKTKFLICISSYHLILQPMKECFESKDIGMLQEVILKMPKEDAEYHMKRCVDSGLWVPNANDDSHPIQEQGEQEEETYEDVH